LDVDSLRMHYTHYDHAHSEYVQQQLFKEWE